MPRLLLLVTIGVAWIYSQTGNNIICKAVADPEGAQGAQIFLGAN